ncbi:hypothetical protein Scep_028891 [Stephania cephalantha]|uniref:F-box domain-containing protein n=1 Tax=Stephania cephalantha TaxID=152367 RepID=A0AAP0EAU0_9MAGN
MESLPREIIVNILTRLPIMSVLQLKKVCRSWRTFMQDASLSTMLLAVATERNPCLILHHDSPIRNQLFFLDDDAKNGYSKAVRKVSLPFTSVMPEFDVSGSCNGFLCLSDSLLAETIFLYNPFFQEHMELPKTLNCANHDVVIGFGFVSASNEYKVIRIVYYMEPCDRLRRSVYQQRSQVDLFTLGKDHSWRIVGSAKYRIHRHSPKILLNGFLHWVVIPYNCRPSPSRIILAFDFATEKFEVIPCPRWERPVRHTFQLAEIQGCLSAVVNWKDGSIDIWIMKEYKVRESWMKEFTIGNYVPIGLNPRLSRPIRIWRNGMSRGSVQVLCSLKCGKLLLEYENQALVCYDPLGGNFEEFIIQGLPEWFRSVVTHVGNLLSFEAEIVRSKSLSGDIRSACYS